jgi:hypothetical protein
MKEYGKVSRRTGISYIQQNEGRIIGLVTSCVETDLKYILMAERYRER